VRIRFHLDEHVPMSIAAGLRRRGVDVTTATGEELTGASDAGQLSFAAQSGRVLVTQDADFLRLHQTGVGHTGIVYCRQGSLSVGEMLRRLVLVHDLMTAEEMRTRVEYL
jgi:predicted nuclease of predicted toxin-antitoxin system